MRRQQDVPGAPGDVIRLNGVTKAYQAGAPPANTAPLRRTATNEAPGDAGP